MFRKRFAMNFIFLFLAMVLFSTNVIAAHKYASNYTSNYGSRVTLTTNNLNSNWNTSNKGRFITHAMWLNFQNGWLEMGVSDGGWEDPLTGEYYYKRGYYYVTSIDKYEEFRLSSPTFTPGETRILTIVRDDYTTNKWHFKIGSTIYKSETIIDTYGTSAMHGIETNDINYTSSDVFTHANLQTYNYELGLGLVWKQWSSGEIEELPSGNPLNAQWITKPYSFKAWY